ncbi:hypothetical protein EW146_g745 [Bondarzewia mesenterica]|uniref:Uncharacterized protein n=1 Tax=Bondarzewia mesenterica TaxID=1095465 RepID=A0A4S4M5W8_9AGAM|nr:hypothetical protein EW146_g745 [Bondarzewia mesenterica]
MHSWSFQKAIFSALFVQGGNTRFDYAAQYLKFDLRYRPGNDGNPSTAFTVESTRFLPLSEINPESGIGRALEAGRPLRERDAVRWHEKKPDTFLDFLLAMYTIDDSYSLWTAIPQTHVAKELSPEISRTGWLLELRETVRRGTVFRQTSPGDIAWHAGQMVKNGKRWCWRRLEVDDLAAMGMRRADAKLSREIGHLF